MCYVDFHTDDGIVTCGPFKTFEKAQDFALSVDPEVYGVAVFRSPETDEQPRRRRDTVTENMVYRHMERV